MTEEQLLAQSADDYMNAGQLEYFELLLQGKARSVRERISANQSICMTEHRPEASATVFTVEDRATALRLIDMDNQKLKQISYALGAIADDSYGWCVETGEPIGLNRLLLTPESLLGSGIP